jgi:hypothetical protein
MAVLRQTVATAAVWARLEFDPQPALWTTIGLMGALLVGALAIYLTDRWRKRSPQERMSANDQMAHFRTLFDRGELSREEYDRIRGLLTERLKREMEVAPAPPPETKPPESKPPEPPKLNGPAS